MKKGYRNVRPLVGGLDAWLAEGRSFEEDDAPESSPARPQ
jgi:3-mercaptopyruvate sulfurtransferase SseA